MTDIPPDSRCKSARCRQIGRCNCLHVYDDGRPVAGSGTADNPYRHEVPPIVCVQDAAGNTLVPDDDRCVTIPQGAIAIQLSDGTVVFPNSSGIITIPSTFMSSFNIIDEDGNVLTIQDDAEVLFDIDGGITQGYVQDEIVYPTVLGTTVIFPAEKGRYTQYGDIFVDQKFFSSGIAPTTNPVFDLTDPIRVPTGKHTHYRLSLGLSLVNRTPTFSPSGGQYTVYSIGYRIENADGSNASTQTAGRGYWSPLYGRNYVHDTYVVDIDTQLLGLDPTQDVVISPFLTRDFESGTENSELVYAGQAALHWV